MKEYKIRNLNPIIANDDSKVFFEALQNKIIFDSYEKIERRYIDIIFNIIGLYSEYLLDVEFIYDLGIKERKYYLENDRHSLDLLNMQIEGRALKFSHNDLKNYIKLVIREHIRAQILTPKSRELLFGYIYDLQTIVSSDNLTSKDVAYIQSQGFEIKEFYIDFEK